NLATAGLIFAEVMARFNHPEYIGRNLVRVVPTKRNGDKLISVSRFPTASAAALGRQPGEAHTELGFGEAYQTTPETVERAAKCVVTRESVYFDVTDQVLDQAGEVGDQPAYRMEIDIADHVLGVTNSYNRNGTAFNTYQTATPYINDQANPFTDENDIDEARQLFVGMTDPETGREIRVDARTILCTPGRELKFREQIYGSNVQIGTQLNTNFPSRWRTSPGELSNVGSPGDTGPYTLIPMSSIWYNRITAADGLAQSAANAKEWWWMGEFGGPNSAFEWRSNWDLQPWSAQSDELTLKDRGLIAVYGASYRGTVFSREPRRVVRNKAP
ncbi:MAG TPA: hypothetical protein VKD72_20875, partial [Gemmataceae bacterium]|nr:hypothetical protein [Gemmataceae bacterium]